MDYFRRMGMLLSLLLGGAMGHLTTPLLSHALTVTIDGRAVQLAPTTASPPCSTGYNLCAFIPAGTYGRLAVADVSSSNRARIMIGDNSTAGSLDLMKLTGIKFTPVGVTAGTTTTTTATIVVTHTYNAGGGNPAGDYAWGYGMAGYLDPPTNENIVGDQLKQTGQGNFAGKIAPLGLGLDTGKFATPTTLNLNGSVTKSRAATVVMPACNTGSNRCAPAITQTFTLTMTGADTLVLSDSVIAAGGTCRQAEAVIPIPPLLYKLMLKLDPQAPNDINQLPMWLADMGEKYLHKPTQKKLLAYLIRELEKWLAATVPGTCAQVQTAIEEIIEDDVEAHEAYIAELAASLDELFAPAQPGGSTITIRKETSEATNTSFQFTLVGPSASADETIDMGGQTSQFIVIPVEPGNYSLTEIPRAGWDLTNVTCSGGQINLSLNLALGDNVDCTFTNSPSNASNAVLHIRKQLSIFCDGSCAPLTFGFQILGPPNLTASVTTDGSGQGVTSVPVTAGTYSVVEESHGSFGLQNSFCSVDGGEPVPTTDVVIPSGASVTCIFVNEPLL